jgi:hypothetical protein
VVDRDATTARRSAVMQRGSDAINPTK